MNFSRYIVLALKGCAMGMADVVPGVSGGTIAFISGIYEELLDSIRSVNATALKLLLKLRLGEFWRHINGSFLLPVLLGIAIAIFSLARLMTYLLTYHPIAIWSPRRCSSPGKSDAGTGGASSRSSQGPPRPGGSPSPRPQKPPTTGGS